MYRRRKVRIKGEEGRIENLRRKGGMERREGIKIEEGVGKGQEVRIKVKRGGGKV